MEIEWKLFFKDYETGQKDKVLKKIDSLTGKILNKPDKKGDLPLILSCKRGIHELADLFIQKGAQVDIQDSNNGLYSPLLYACEKNFIDLVCFLLDKGAKINQVNEEGFSALQIACQYGYQELAKILIDKGADINFKNLNEKTSLYLACLTNQLEIVKLLLEKNVDSKSIGSDYFYSDYFFYQPYNEEIMLYLFKNDKTFLNDSENSDETMSTLKIIFEKACRFGHKGLLEYLIEQKGVKLSDFEMNDVTPLYLAYQNDQLEIAEFLIKKGAHLNSADPCQDPVLYSALREEKLEFIKLVVENGARLTDRNVFYMDYAKSQENKEIYIFLSIHVIGQFYNLISDSKFESILIESIETFEEEKHFFLLSQECLRALKVLLKFNDLAMKASINEPIIEAFRTFFDSIDFVKEKLNTIVVANSMRQLSSLEKISQQIRIQSPDLSIETVIQKLNLESTEELDENGEIKIKTYRDIKTLSSNGKLFEIIDSEKAKEAKLSKAYSYYKSAREFMAKNRERQAFIQDLIKFLGDQKDNLIKCSSKRIEENNQLLANPASKQKNKDNKQDLDLYKHVNNPLIIGAENKRFELVEFLINKNIKSKDDLMAIHDHEQMPLLFILCKNGAPELVKRLIEKYKIDLNLQIADGSTLLHMAILHSQNKLVEYLVQSGANLNLRNNSNVTCLTLACQQGSMNQVKLLVSKGADKNCQDYFGSTAIMRALYTESGHEIAEFLIKNGANVNLRDKNGQTALLHVCQTGPSKLAQLLIEKGADINCSDRYGKTCLVEACKSEDFDKVIDIMVQRGVNIKQALTDDNSVASIVNYLKRTNHLKLTNLLIQNINVNEKNQDGSTVLHIACEYANFKLVKLLVEKDADINALNKQFHTPLHNCCMTNCLVNSQGGKHVEIAKFLIEKGADLSVRNELEQTYLSFVCAQDLAYDSEKDLNELKKIFRNISIKSLHKAFNYKDVSLFRQKVVESINNKNSNSFEMSWDHVQAFKLLGLDSENRSANNFDDMKMLEYFAGFEFKEKLLEDVLNNLKGEKETLEIAKAKLNQGFSELDDIQQTGGKFVDFDNQYDYFELKRLIVEQDLINLVLAENNVNDKLKKKMQLLSNIDHFLSNIEEKITVANYIFEMINQGIFAPKQTANK